MVLQQMLTQQRSGENVKRIVIQHASQYIFNLDETSLFYNSQVKRTLELKGEKCQGGKWHKDRIMVLLCCSADGTKKICQSVISKFVKPHGLKALKHYPYDYKSHKKTQVTGRFSSECLVSFEKKMACQDRNMPLLMEPCAAHNEKGTTLKHFHQISPATCNHWTRTSYRVKELNILKACSMLFVVCGGGPPCSHKKNIKNGKYWKLWQVFPWHGNSPLIQNCFAKCCFSSASSVNVNEANCKCVKLQCHTDCPSTFNEFLNFDKSVPATHNETSVDTPGPNSMDKIGQEEEKTENTWPLPTQPLRKIL